MFIYLLLLISLNSVAYASGDSSTVSRKRHSGLQTGNLHKKQALSTDVFSEQTGFYGPNFLSLLPTELWVKILNHVQELNNFSQASRWAHSLAWYTRIGKKTPLAIKFINDFSIVCDKMLRVHPSITSLSQLALIKSDWRDRSPLFVNENILQFYCLRHLDVSEITLAKSDVDLIKQISSLRSLDCSFCQDVEQDLGGVPLDHLLDGSSLSQLKRLNLYGNALTTQSVGNIGQFSGLLDLDLGLCELNELPKNFGNLSKLHTLAVNHNTFSLDTLVDGKRVSNAITIICSLKALRILNLGATGIIDLPKNFTNLTNLKQLFLFNNDISQYSISLITQLPAIELLDLSCCELTADPSFGDIQFSHSITELILHDNASLHPNWLKGAGVFKKLNHLDLQRCEIAELPEEFKLLKNIHTIRLQGNNGLTAESIVPILRDLRIKELNLNRGVLSQEEIKKHFPGVLVKEIEPVEEIEPE